MTERLKDPRIHGALRHLLTSIGPVVAAQGWATETAWQMGVGVVIAGLGFWASWTASEKKAARK